MLARFIFSREKGNLEPFATIIWDDGEVTVQCEDEIVRDRLMHFLTVKRGLLSAVGTKRIDDYKLYIGSGKDSLEALNMVCMGLWLEVSDVWWIDYQEEK